jgi:DUF971 family protein
LGVYRKPLRTLTETSHTGIYSWDYLYSLGVNQDELWRQYLRRLKEASASREPTPGAFPERPKSK